MTERIYIAEPKRKLHQSKKGILVFTVIIFGACFLTGAADFFFQNRFTGIMQLCGLLFLGGVFAGFMQMKTFMEKETFSYSLYIAAALLISLIVFYFVKGGFQLLEILSLSSAFLLPNVVMEAWRIYHFVVTKNKPFWFYSKDIPDEPLFVYFENKPVHVKMLIKDEGAVMISSVAPLSSKLGMAVFYIIKKRIDDNDGDWRKLFVNEEGRPYKWLLYSKSFGLVKIYFHPDETLNENKIKSNTVIVAKRLE